MEYNLNRTVKVKLTHYGKKILYNEYLELVKLTHETNILPFNEFTKDKHDVMEYPLWELMNIFGKYLYMGNEYIPFENNIINIKEHNI